MKAAPGVVCQNAFSYGDLDEEIWMHQPQGFFDGSLRLALLAQIDGEFEDAAARCTRAHDPCLFRLPNHGKRTTPAALTVRVR
jgi:hypothetical protein